MSYRRCLLGVPEASGEDWGHWCARHSGHCSPHPAAWLRGSLTNHTLEYQPLPRP